MPLTRLGFLVFQRRVSAADAVGYRLEQALVSDYLQRPTLFALPASQRKLVTIILRRLLASSTHAISSTLDALASKLDAAAQTQAAPGLKPEKSPRISSSAGP